MVKRRLSIALAGAIAALGVAALPGSASAAPGGASLAVARTGNDAVAHAARRGRRVKAVTVRSKAAPAKKPMAASKAKR